MTTAPTTSVHDVTLRPAVVQALELLRQPPEYAADVHRNIEAAELLLSAALALYERHAGSTPPLWFPDDVAVWHRRAVKVTAACAGAAPARGVGPWLATPPANAIVCADCAD